LLCLEWHLTILSMVSYKALERKGTCPENGSALFICKVVAQLK
jgi:hypothetical protein